MQSTLQHRPFPSRSRLPLREPSEYRRLPRGWPNVSSGKPRALAWDDEATRKDYRGFGIVTRALASHTDHHQVSELVIDANTLETGLNCRVYEQPNAEYNDFATILRRPGFTHLDLALLVRGQEFKGWPCFRNRYLHRALAEAHSLQHISLSTNVDADPASDTTIQGTGGSRAQLVLLRTIFPVERWHTLRHFSLSNFLVDKNDLVSFLAALPSATLCSVHLGFLYFVDHGGNWHELLEDMRNKLDWRWRDPAVRPTVSVAVPTFYIQTGHAVWVDEEVREFLYEGGPNPFYWGNEAVGQAGVVRDAFMAGVEWVNNGY
ncbi:hypothetical protein BDW59DRAFT_152170 [Aspergillus cavernicola]|uniref:Uncharacterized protein n=1 Tax=Aspergillus cavernicola TaxID=176166 RepID=A0ABR4HS40_9EURO